VNSALVGIFFFLYVFFLFFILANMFIIIIFEAYHATREAEILHGRELEANDYIGQVSLIRVFTKPINSCHG
jgi:hypothetical protein